MVDIYKFEKFLKHGWMKHILSKPESPWNLLLQESCKNIFKMFYVGPEWFQQQLPNLNPFWCNVFENWITFCRNQKVKTGKDLLSSSICYNRHISPESVFYGTWFKKGCVRPT